MKPKTCVRSISDWATSIGIASATRTFLTVAILSVAASLYWSTGAAAQIGVFADSPHTTVVPTALTGETITVTTCNDVVDFGGAQSVSDLPGPDGRVSFREATIAANLTAGPQTIAFAIPVSEFWLVTDVALLKLEQGAFFLVDSGTTVDFSTQTTNIGNTNPNGPEVGIYGLQPNGAGVAAIFVNGDNCVIKGLGLIYQRGYGVELVGDNNRVIGSRITGAYNAGVNIEGSGAIIPTGNVVGGTAPGEGNYLTGMTIRGPADGNIVVGNTVIGGLDVQGATRYGVSVHNNRIGGTTPAERNVIAGAGYYGEEGYPNGAQVRVIDADGTIVEGNYIGTTVDGMARYPQQIGPDGVEIRDSRGTTIRGNLIAGLRTVGTYHYAGQIFGQAIYVGATNENTSDSVIEGNTIGLAADGVTPIVTRKGITVLPMSSNYHAFGTRIASNHIAGVETTGIVVGSQENGITIAGNSIHDSGLLGIDLFYNFNGIGGVTLNDAGDVDIGGNGLQNFPVLQSAATTGSVVMVQGTLDSSSSGQFKVEFFASPSCDPSGFGEGAKFLGSTLVTTDGAGHSAFSATLPAAVAVGAKATTTATRLSTGDTSEFSACVTVTQASIPRSQTAFDFDGDGKTDIGIFRPAGGEWWINRSLTGVTSGMQFGAATDAIAPADYTGDRKADIAVFRPSSGEWYVLRSEDNSFFAFPFGANGDIPAPADYDADGKADFAVFRPSTATWFISQSSGAPTRIFQFGVTGDLPVVADYDGDQKADVGIFRPGQGEWWIQRSTAGLLAMQFGTGTDKPVQGDYTGDGKTDVAIWKPSTGEWFIVRSEDFSFFAFPFGANGDAPAPGDYDGDGKTDPTVFRPSSATWFIARSTAGTQILQFGANGDKPLPSSFVP